LLKQNANHFESALLYVSDHGESLGENGVYLHGLPYTIAPDAQKHTAMIMWFSDNFDNKEITPEFLKNNANNKYTQDSIFHTLLGLMEVKTSVYNRALDLLTHGNNTKTANHH
jgi:lipid A ethanolaminephosphotransferase